MKSLREVDAYIGKMIKITYCWSRSPNYFNVVPGSLHKIIQAEKNSKNSEKGVWIKGIDSPIRILAGEFEFTNFKLLSKRK